MFSYISTCNVIKNCVLVNPFAQYDQYLLDERVDSIHAIENVLKESVVNIRSLENVLKTLFD